MTLYILNFSKRPFNNNRGEYNYQKVMHNMLYSFLGVFQATIWESIMIYCYATNRINYLPDSDIWKNKYNAFIFLSSCLWVLFTESATFILHIDFCIFVRCTNMSIVCITATLISSLSQACPCILSNTCTTLHQLLPVWCCKYSRILRALLAFSLSLSIFFAPLLEPL